MRTLFLIYGGKSQEHDISILTAKNISQVLSYDQYDVLPIYITKQGKWYLNKQLKTGVKDDSELTQLKQEILPTEMLAYHNPIAFPVLHGPNGEDGTIQGLFEILNIAYVGVGVLGSATGMDKVISKQLFETAGLPQLPYVHFLNFEWHTQQEKLIQKCEQQLDYPMFVKPANLGSSVGISQATNQNELIQAVNLAFQYDRKVVVEQGVVAREVEIAVLGNNDIKASVVGEVIKVVDFYNFEEKYKNNQATLQIPANISSEISDQLRNYAIQAFRAIDGSGLTRCDFFLTKNNEIYINEVNTLPGFTQYSMYPLLWEATGLNYKDLVTELLELAQDRFNEKQTYQEFK